MLCFDVLHFLKLDERLRWLSVGLDYLGLLTQVGARFSQYSSIHHRRIDLRIEETHGLLRRQAESIRSSLLIRLRLSGKLMVIMVEDMVRIRLQRLFVDLVSERHHARDRQVRPLDLPGQDPLWRVGQGTLAPLLALLPSLVVVSAPFRVGAW